MNWQVIPIRAACPPTQTVDPSTAPDDFFDYIDISGIDRVSKRITSTSRLLGVDAPSRARKQVRAGDILVSTVRPNLNAVAIVPTNLDDQVASTGFCVLRPNQAVFDRRFLFLFTRTANFIEQLLRHVRGANYPAVTDRNVYDAELPMPALYEQRRIVEILDQADALRQQRADADAKVQRILPALFHKMFGDPSTNPNGWPVEPLEKLARVQGGFAFKSDDFVASGVLLVRIGNLVDGTTIARDNAVFLPLDFLDQYSSFQLENNDLLIALTGATTGKLARFTADFPALLNQRVGRFVPTQDDRAALDYLHQLMRTSYAQSYIWQFARGFGQPNVAPKQIEQMPVPIPPPGLVTEFSGRARQAHEITAQGSKATADIQRVFDVLLHRAFTGELTATWREAHREQLEREQAEQLRVLQQSSPAVPPRRRERRTRTEARS